MPRLIQPSFARGEFGPDLYGRVDIAAYAVALRTAINLIVHAYGGASNRPGLKWVGPCRTHTGTPPVLIEFKFNTSDTYILEFGNEYMRVIRNDAHVLETAVNISGATAADPVVVTATSHGFSDGDDVYVDGVVGMTELNGRFFRVANQTTNTFELTSQQTLADIDGTAYTAYSSGGTASRVYQITTPYQSADLLELKHVQSANVMTLTNRTYAPRELTRTDHDSWTLTEITFAPEQGPPTGVQVSASGSGTDTRYRVTAINEDDEEESLPGLDNTSKTITGATAADPVVITATSHGFANGDEVQIDSIVGMTELNERRFTVANQTTNTFELLDEDGSAYTAYSSGGTAAETSTNVSGAATPNNTITWSAVTGAYKYSVYRLDNGLYGWLGDTEELTFTDNNLATDLTITPPRARNPFLGTGNFPGATSYYEQRRIFGRTTNKPDTTFYSVTGSQANMSQSSPRQADDAITATLNALEVNAIEAFVPLNDLLIFTSGQEWKVNSGQEVAFSAENLRQKPQSNWGSSYLPPIVVGDKVLFVTENRSYIRSLGYELTIDGYTGNDMTVFSPHLFRDDQIVDWAFTRSPDPLIATIRADGWAPVLTFNPEQEVVAWSRWNTDGKFLRVASTRPESTSVDPAGYFVVERKVGGTTAFFIERIAGRRFEDVRDCFFVDAGLSLDVPVAITGATAADPVVLTTGAAHGLENGDEVDVSDILWEPDVDSTFNYTQPAQLNDFRYYVADKTSTTLKLVEIEGRVDVTAATAANPVVLTAVAHGLADGDAIGVFDVGGMTELNGRVFTVANKTDDTFELSGEDGTAHTAYVSGGNVYPAVDGSAFNAYDEAGFVRKAVTELSGLWHLEGREVIVLADGAVISGHTVSGGAITLSRKASRVHIGLRFISDLGTLDPEVSGGPGQTLQGRTLRVPRVTVRFKDTRGVLIGPDTDALEEIKQREFETYGQPTALLTGDKEVDISSDWDGGGRVYIRQINPLPMTVTAIIPYIEVGDEDEE